MQRLELTPKDTKAIAEAIGKLTETVEKAGLTISIQHKAILLNFVARLELKESPCVRQGKPFDIADGARLDIAEGAPCDIGHLEPVCKFGPGGDFVQEWPPAGPARDPEEPFDPLGALEQMQTAQDRADIEEIRKNRREHEYPNFPKSGATGAILSDIMTMDKLQDEQQKKGAE